MTVLTERKAKYTWASQVVLVVKNPPGNTGDTRDADWSLGQEEPPEEKMAVPSSVLAWRIPRTEEAGGLQTRLKRLLFVIQMLSDVWLFGLHGLQHARPPCLSPSPGVYSNSCPSSQWCHPPTPSSVLPFSSCPQSFSASGSFPVSQFFASGGQSTGV